MPVHNYIICPTGMPEIIIIATEPDLTIGRDVYLVLERTKRIPLEFPRYAAAAVGISIQSGPIIDVHCAKLVHMTPFGRATMMSDQQMIHAGQFEHSQNARGDLVPIRIDFHP